MKLGEFLCEKKDCTGCGACIQRCPHRSIEMRTDEEGFAYPAVQESCVHCGICGSVCPALNPAPAEGQRYPVGYALKNTDDVQIRISASGAAFPAFADYVLNQGGVVYGTIWDHQLRAVIARAEKREEMAGMYGSKYVQSDTGDMYAIAERDLKEGKLVLFSGVGCQIAGLRSFLRKEYPNLVTLQIICHGAGSPGVFQDYLRNIQRRFGSRPVWLCQTDWKNRKWNELIQKYVRFCFEDGREEQWDSSEDGYLSLFLNNVLYREACYHCRYACLPQVGDLTLGDYGGFALARHCAFDKTGGVSQVLVNTARGRELFEACQKEKRFVCEERPLKECLVFNHNLWKPSERPAARDAYFAAYRKFPYSQVEEKFLSQNSKKQAEKLLRRGIKKILGPKWSCGLLYLTFCKNRVPQKVDQVISELEEKREEIGI